MSDDITFCADKCKRKKCFRNPINIKVRTIPHSYSHYKRTDYCPFKEEIEGSKHGT